MPYLPEHESHSYSNSSSFSGDGICMLVNPQCACRRRVTVVVSLCVCVSVKSNLTSRASVHHENVTYSACNGGQKFVEISLKSLRCRDTPLPTL